MRLVDAEKIASTGAVRFRSEYDYAVFEYWRSAKVLSYLTRNGVDRLGRMLDAGCGGGGMCVSFAEEAPFVAGIDLEARFRQAGERLARERGVKNLVFAQANGQQLPFGDAEFDLTVSHAVIEHVADPLTYLRELRRVTKPGGRVFVQTGPYLSPHGSHLPPLKIRVPLHLVIGRRAAFATSVWLARHWPSALNVPATGSSFHMKAQSGDTKTDDLLYKVTVRNLRANIRQAGFTIVREELYVSRLAHRISSRLARKVPSVPFVRDVLVNNMEYLLAP